MSGEVARIQKVIVTRVGAFWVDVDRADKIDQIREQDPEGVIDIDGNRVQARAIYATLTPEQYSNWQNERRGLWQCQYKNWHPRNDVCYCARDVRNQPPKEPQPEMSEEDRAKARAKLDEIRKNISKKGIRGLNK